MSDGGPAGAERLQKWMARLGIAPSRRAAERWIDEGRVRVDGEIATLGTKATDRSTVEVDGVLVDRRRDKPRVLLLHKPKGVVTTMHDPHGRPTVLDLVPEIPGLHPVGRLDADSEGLLLLTNDGDLTYRLTHPKFEHSKVYDVWCLGGPPGDDALERLRRGLVLDDGPARADAVHRTKVGARIEIHEGRKRQVRRMMEAVGHPVERLLRTDVAGVSLGTLQPGTWREATAAEMATLGYAHGALQSRSA